MMSSPAKSSEEIPRPVETVDIEDDGPPPPGIVSLDLRSLALFRIAFGVVILLDLLARLPEIRDFYTDDGVLPRAFMFHKMRSLGAYSLQFMSGEWAVQLAIFLVMIAVAICFIVGYRTRLSAVLGWLLIMSMQGRNPFVLHGGDDVMRILLFWCIFAPLNGRWSVDAALNRDRPPLPIANASWGSQALMLQLCFIYWTTAAWKWHPVWTKEGSAIYYALSLTQFTKPFGTWLVQFPHVLQFLTFATISLEFFGPFLLFVPVGTRWFRLFVMLSFIGLHAGIFLTMEIGLFPWICMAAWLMVMPSMVWDQGDRLWARLSSSVRSFVRAWRVRIGESLIQFFARFRKPLPPKEELGPVASVFVVSYALIVFAINFQTLPSVNGRVPVYIAFAEVVLGLHQRWAMFAPFPMSKDGWYVVTGTRPDGQKIDIWNGGKAPTMAKPNVLDSYRDVRWNKYLNAITFDFSSTLRPYFADYLCRSWNKDRKADSQVRFIAIDFITRINQPPGKPLEEWKREGIWMQPCVEQPKR